MQLRAHMSDLKAVESEHKQCGDLLEKTAVRIPRLEGR